MLRFFLLLLLVFNTAFFAHAERNIIVESADKGKRIALVIGNSHYLGAPALKNPVNDARDMARALRELGFEVIDAYDVGQRDMNRAIVRFGGKLNGDSVALFYYAGHGMQVRGKNYLLPIDAEIATENAVRAETVDVDSVLDQLTASPLNIVILDACRNNPFERRWRSMGGGLAQMDAPQGTLIAYATAPGKTAADGEGRNGLYTQELLKAMQEPGVAIEQMFKRVRTQVGRLSGNQQTPWESSSLTGDFYFLQSPPSSSPQVFPLPQTTPNAAVREKMEFEIWQLVQARPSTDAYEDYLRKFPDGQYADRARLEIARLNPPKAPLAPLANLVQGALTRTIGNGRRWLIVVQEPNCSYCKRLEAELERLHDITIHTHVIAYSPQAAMKLDAILCNPNPAATWVDWMVREVEPQYHPPCKKLAQEQTPEVRRMLAAIQATPKILFPDGSEITGFINAETIEERGGSV